MVRAALMRSDVPYRVRDGRPYCATHPTLRLVRIEDTRWLTCRVEGYGRTYEDEGRRVRLTADGMICDSCGINHMVRTPGTGKVICPSCDGDPTRLDELAPADWMQPSLPLEGVAPEEVPYYGEGSRKAQPDSVVRRCPDCRQTIRHDYVFDKAVWKLRCSACHKTQPKARDKASRRTVRRDRAQWTNPTTPQTPPEETPPPF